MFKKILICTIVPCLGSLALAQTQEPKYIYKKSIATLKTADSPTNPTDPVVPKPELTVSQDALQFSNTFVGGESSQTILLGNTGTANLVLSSITSSSTDYLPSHNCNLEVASGASCPVLVRFIPTTEGSKSATLTITAAGNISKTVSLAGTATPALVENLLLQDNPSLVFPDTAVGSNNLKTFVFANMGTATASGVFVTESSSELSLESNTCGTSSTPISLGVNQSCTVSVRYTPTLVQDFSGSVLLKHVKNSTTVTDATLALSGKSTGPSASLEPKTSADFGLVSAYSGVSREFTFNNTGTATLTGVYANLVGTGMTYGTNTCGTSSAKVSIAIGGKCTVIVNFSSNTDGAVAGAKLSVITANALNGPFEQPLTATVVSAVDPYIANVSLLLKMDNISGEQNSVSGTSVSILGTLTPITNSVRKFGVSSYGFPATGSNALIAQSNGACAFGTGDFTVEGWVYRAAAGHQVIIASTNGVPNAGFYLMWNNTLGKWRFNPGTGSALDSANMADRTGRWIHLAISRTSGITKMFVDGVDSGSIVDTSNYTSQSCALGKEPTLTGSNWTGGMDEFRVTKGVGRYTSSFTMPANEFPRN